MLMRPIATLASLGLQGARLPSLLVLAQCWFLPEHVANPNQAVCPEPLRRVFARHTVSRSIWGKEACVASGISRTFLAGSK
jgi:hypothetical protein